MALRVKLTHVSVNWILHGCQYLQGQQNMYCSLLKNMYHSSPSLEKCDAGTNSRGTGSVFTLKVQAPS